MNLITKLSAVVLLSLIAQNSFGQFTVEKRRRVYLGVNAGVNFTLPQVTDRYSVLSASPDSNNGDSEKEYGKYLKNMGTQFGIHFSYNFTNTISLVSGFGYQSKVFNYRTEYSWIDTLQGANVDREMHHRQNISYFTMPIMGKWDMSKGQFKPYVQAGVYMNLRHQANKEIRYDNTIDGEETANQTSSSGMVPISDNTRKFNMAVMGGAGTSYYTRHLTFGLEANFRYGLLKAVNDENRYADINGLALKYLDVMDQFKLSSLNFQFTISAPIGNSAIEKFVRRKRYNSYYSN